MKVPNCPFESINYNKNKIVGLNLVSYILRVIIIWYIQYFIVSYLNKHFSPAAFIYILFICYVQKQKRKNTQNQLIIYKLI